MPGPPPTMPRHRSQNGPRTPGTRTGTPAHAASLRVKSKAKPFDPVTYRPTFKVRVIPGGIRLDWKKRGVDAVAVYCRVAGTLAFKKIGMDTVSPYLDARPLMTPGVPEVRE